MTNRLLIYITLLLVCIPFISYAQEGEKVYRFLNLPTSTHVNALGGSNVSLVDNDISLVFHNPALLGEEMNMNVNVNYMSYIADIGYGSAIFGKSINELSTFAVGLSYLDYGDMKQASAENEADGNFSAKEWVLNGVYSRDLTPFLRGGVAMKFLYSSIDSYSSTAIGVDVGLSYYNKDKSFSAGLAIKNVGAQLSAYNEKRVSLPWDVQLGLTKRLGHSPLRLSVTGIYLNQWKFEKVNKANGINDDEDSFFKTFTKHLVFGLDVIPTENLWLGVGYSPKVHSDLKIQDGNKWGGWNLGAGVRVKRFNIGFSFAQYHPDATSYHFSLSFDLSKL
ncbi:MAG: type IX secretion system protein PorQ [Dysgonomonas sp.]